MAANAGSMFQYWKRFDLQQLQVSPTFCSNRVASIRLGRLASRGPPRLSPVRRPPRRLFRGKNSRPLPHIDESGSLADQKLILFVQFNIDRTLQPAKPGRRRGDAPK